MYIDFEFDQSNLKMNTMMTSFYCDPQTQSRHTEKMIKDDFETLCLFLKREEETRIAALRKEETQKIRMMQLITEMSRNTYSLSDTIKNLEECGANSFIQVIFKTQEKCNSK